MNMNQDLNLKPGEIYVGAIGDQAGNLYHIILLPGENDDATWEAQKEWATSIGGELPTRVEQAMLWQNCCDQFKADLYWSGETHALHSDRVWFQDFHGGRQYHYNTNTSLYARAVRRIEVTK